MDSPGPTSPIDWRSGGSDEAGLEQNFWAGLDDLMEDGSDYEDI